jgi:hypothetical protein
MDVFALTMRLKEEGAAQVKSAVDKMGRSLTDATGKSSLLDKAYGDLKSTMLGFASVAAVGTVLSKIAEETSAAEFASAQLNAALKSTRNVAGQSVEALNAHARALAQVSIYDDDAITGAQALLLTFTKLTGDTFPKATQAVLNVATAMGTDLKSAAIQVGKALNDPILGVSALARSGIQFTEAQKLMIEQLVESNRLMEAQTIILGELETQFGNSAKAASETFGGALKKLSNDIGDALTLTGDGVNIATKSVQYLSTVVRGLRQFFDQVMLLGEMAYVNVSGIFRIMKAMESPKTYVEAYRQITAEMEASRTKFRAAYLDAADVSAMSKEAASFITQMGSSTTVTAGAFGMFSASVFKATTALQGFAAAKDKAASAGAGGVGSAGRVPTLPSFDVSAAATSSVGSIKPGAVTAIDPAHAAQARASMVAMGESIEKQAAETLQKIRDSVAGQVASTFANAIASGMEAAVANKSIGAGFKAFGAVLLAGIGDILIRFGTQALLMSKLMAAFYDALPKNPIAAAGIAVAMIALGGALKGAATLAGNSGSDRPPPMSSFAVGGGGGSTSTLPTLTYGPTSAAGASGLSPMGATNITIIGPNDPVAQRAMQELMTKANRRGNV